jgi:hypothetical protein
MDSRRQPGATHGKGFAHLSRFRRRLATLKQILEAARH